MRWDIALDRMKEMGISQYQLSIDLGKDKSQVKKWIARDNTPPGDCILKIATILKVRPEIFFPEMFPDFENITPIRQAFQEFIDMSSDEELQKMWDFFELMRGRE